MKKMRYLLIAVLLIISITACKKKSDDAVTDTVDIAGEEASENSGNSEEKNTEQTVGENAGDGTETDTNGEDSADSENKDDNTEADKTDDDTASDTQPSNENNSDSKDANSKDNTGSQKSSNADKNTDTSKEDKNVDAFQLVLKDGSTLTYKKYELSKDYQDENMLCLYFEYTNQSKEPTSASDVFMLNCYQDGKECEGMILLDGPEEFKNMMKSIKKGDKITVCSYFYLEEVKSVELEIAPYDEKDTTKKVTKKLDISI